MSVHILGISAYYHDSAACLLRDGEIVAAAQEERFTRKKGDAAFPHHAVDYCLRAGRHPRRGPRPTSASTTSRCSSSSGSSRPTSASRRAGFRSFLRRGRSGSRRSSTSTGSSATSWATRATSSTPSTTSRTRRARSFPRRSRGRHPHDRRRRRMGDGLDRRRPRQRHRDARASCTGPTRSACSTRRSRTTPASRSTPASTRSWAWRRTASRSTSTSLLDELIDLREDGSFTLNQKYFNYLGGLTMTNGAFDELFGGAAARARDEADAARDGPRALGPGGCEEVMLRMARTAHRETGTDEPLPRRRRRAQLRRQRPDAARGAVRATLDPAGRRRRRRRARRRAAHLAPALSAAARPSTPQRRDEGRLPRSRVLARRDRGVPRLGRARRIAALRAGRR